MATFRVRGTKRQTGEPITGRMKAATRQRAEEHLRKMGITVTDIIELPPEAPPPPEGAALPERPAPAEGRPTPHPQPKPPPEAPPGAKGDALLTTQGRWSPEPPPEAPAEEGRRIYIRAPVPVRSYGAVALIVMVLRAMAAMLLLLFVLVVLLAIIAIAGNGAASLLILVPMAVGLLIFAGLTLALAELLQMQRDVAQNSARADERLAHIEELMHKR